jgi:hypothetical protein
MMRSVTQFGDEAMPELRRRADRAYQVVTVAAILAVLATVWVF